MGAGLGDKAGRAQKERARGSEQTHYLPFMFEGRGAIQVSFQVSFLYSTPSFLTFGDLERILELAVPSSQPFDLCACGGRGG